MKQRKPLLAIAKECTGCLACTDSCQHNAINYYIGNDGHYYVEVNEEQCVGCLICENVCPITSKQKYGESENALFYAAWNKDDAERMESASGGAFSAMAHYMIERGGVVIGAATQNVCDVRHIAITDIEGLKRLQGSKYTQSNTSSIYRETYELLKEGRMVLFSGTGCQVGGLLSYLKKKKYEGKLITVDLICGGVPSKLLLQKFVENEPYEVKRIVSYRTKVSGWKPKGFIYNLKVEDAEGKIHDYTGKRNMITTAFSTEMTNRYSCYDCNFVGTHRKSDFTIGDLWGDDQFPNEHHSGLSLVVVHNEKANQLLAEMNNYLATSPCNSNSAIVNNYRLVDGTNVRGNLWERKLMSLIFKKCSYKVLKKVYANDYPNYSLWVILKIVRKICVAGLKIFVKV